MKIFKNGLLTGLTLQLAIGPVFFYVINLTLQKNILGGLVAVKGSVPTILIQTINIIIGVIISAYGLLRLVKVSVND